MIVASDGVWEFVKNDDIINMVVPFWMKKDPEGACEKLCEEAVKAWKRVRNIY
jgi:serine/threonine protein phosphatase PrpC